MAKVNKDNLIHSIAADYVAGSGDTANITYGNLRQKLNTSVYPSGTLEITTNGTYSVTEYANANVNIASGGGGYGGVAVIPIQSIATNTTIEIQ